MAVDKKRLGIVLLAAAGVVGVALLFLIIESKEGEEGPKGPVSVMQELPEAELAEVPKSKLDAYMQRGRAGIEDYWDYMGGDPEESAQQVDPLVELSGEKSPISKTKAPSYEEVFGGLAAAASGQDGRETAEQRSDRRMKENREFAMQMQQQQMEMISGMMKNQENEKSGEDASSGGSGKVDDDLDLVSESAIPERDKIDVNRVKVVRSGGISSMDDDFGNVGTGISSLDSEGVELEVDEAYPFKCMFVRQEKLKSGQRVSIRLLEDIVVEGQLVKKNTHLNAVCTIGDRVDIKVSNMELQGRIVNLDFDGYDNDGVKGIYAPDLAKDTVVEDMLKQAGTQSVRRRMNTAVGQTVQDIISAGSMVITGTGKDRSVTIPAGYQFYLVKHRNK